MKEQQIVIWGTGKYGNLAYLLHNSCNIICYVDSDQEKWGKELNGVKICSPDVLQTLENVKVLLAVKKNREEIKARLRYQYGIRECVIFEIKARDYGETTDKIADSQVVSKETFVVSITSGLGNQMFQYALIKYLETIGKNVLADTSWYVINKVKYEIQEVFPNLNINMCNNEQKEEIIDEAINDRSQGGSFLIYQQPTIYEVDSLKGRVMFDDYIGGYIKGYFQTYYYAEKVKQGLLQDFLFPNVKDSGIERICKIIQNNIVVSVHIRRGDYFIGKNKEIYTNICTEEYYRKAIQYIKKINNKCIFCFFSDDISWVKEHMKYKDAIYVETGMFEDYHNWYDMYLMSSCHHNIIANSTFSWWGAWLNQNPNKVVIAPKKWNNFCEYVDICPDSWIRL